MARRGKGAGLEWIAATLVTAAGKRFLVWRDERSQPFRLQRTGRRLGRLHCERLPGPWPPRTLPPAGPIGGPVSTGLIAFLPIVEHRRCVAQVERPADRNPDGTILQMHLTIGPRPEEGGAALGSLLFEIGQGRLKTATAGCDSSDDLIIIRYDEIGGIPNVPFRGDCQRGVTVVFGVPLP